MKFNISANHIQSYTIIFIIYNHIQSYTIIYKFFTIIYNHIHHIQTYTIIYTLFTIIRLGQQLPSFAFSSYIHILVTPYWTGDFNEIQIIPYFSILYINIDISWRRGTWQNNRNPDGASEGDEGIGDNLITVLVHIYVLRMCTCHVSSAHICVYVNIWLF